MLQFERAGNFKKNVEKTKDYLEQTDNPDFALIGGEFSPNESQNIDLYPIPCSPVITPPNPMAAL